MNERDTLALAEIERLARAIGFEVVRAGREAELLGANNAEVERRRVAEAERDRLWGIIKVVASGYPVKIAEGT